MNHIKIFDLKLETLFEKMKSFTSLHYMLVSAKFCGFFTLMLSLQLSEHVSLYLDNFLKQWRGVLVGFWSAIIIDKTYSQYLNRTSPSFRSALLFSSTLTTIMSGTTASNELKNLPYGHKRMGINKIWTVAALSLPVIAFTAATPDTDLKTK